MEAVMKSEKEQSGIGFMFTKSSADDIELPGAMRGRACGDGGTLTDSRDSTQYPLTLIGEGEKQQCWMAKNLNYGTRIAGTSEQTDNAVVEKYCYDDTESNCTTDGGLYQWDEAMQYSTTTGAQGICPSGWHIPTDDEYKTLEKNLGMSQSDADATGWRGTNEGTKLKVGGSSGFEGVLAGYRGTDGLFHYRGTYAYFWSSLDSGSSAWSRYLYSNKTTVYRVANNKLYGFSVRCIKD